MKVPYRTDDLGFITPYDYGLLLDSGMFWEIYPECTGNYIADKHIIKEREDSNEKI